MTLQRRLDIVETSFTNTRNFPCEIIHYEGSVDPIALRTAYQLLCCRHPILLGTVGDNEDGFNVAVRPDDPCAIVSLEGGEVELRREIHRTSRESLSVAKLILAQGNGSGFLCLCVNHAFCDYAVLGTMFNELWEYYVSTVANKYINLQCRLSLPDSPETLLHERWKTSETHKPSTKNSHTKNNRSSIIRERTLRLSSHDTAQVVKCSKENNLSIHSLVCSAILRSLRREESSSAPAPMVCRSAVDLRNRVAPPVGSTETTVFIGISRETVVIAKGTHPINIAESLHSQLNRAIATRELMMVWEPSPRREPSPLQPHFREILVTNIGVLKPLREPPGVNISDRMIGWLEGQQVPWLWINPHYMIATYHGRLKVIGAYPSEYYTENDISDITDHINDHLHSFADTRRVRGIKE